MMEKGLIIVLSGPSGVGKGTVNKHLLNSFKNLSVAISATTRQPRDGEVNGLDYYFCSEKEFDQKVDNNEFLEHAVVHGNKYGTLLKEVDDKVNSGKDLIFEIDVQGGVCVKEKIPECVSIFLLPPSMQCLSDRLINRATDSQEVIDTRLKNAISEINVINHYDYVIINDKLELCVKSIKNIIKAEKLKVLRNKEKISQLLEGENL